MSVSPEAMSVSPEAVFSYTELRQFIAQHLGKKPAPSTLKNWMTEVLSVKAYNPKHPRQYDLSEAMALVFWGRAGEIARQGERETRAQRRIDIYKESYRLWQSEIYKT